MPDMISEDIFKYVVSACGVAIFGLSGFIVWIMKDRPNKSEVKRLEEDVRRIFDEKNSILSKWELEKTNSYSNRKIEIKEALDLSRKQVDDEKNKIQKLERDYARLLAFIVPLLLNGTERTPEERSKLHELLLQDSSP